MPALVNCQGAALLGRGRPVAVAGRHDRGPCADVRISQERAAPSRVHAGRLATNRCDDLAARTSVQAKKQFKGIWKGIVETYPRGGPCTKVQ